MVDIISTREVTTRPDDKRKVWVVEIPYSEYYSVIVAAIVIGRSTPTVYTALRSGTMSGMRIDGVNHASHKGLITYIARREIRRRKVVDPSRIKPIRVRDRRPPPPRVVVASPTAQELIDSGELDFLNDLRPANTVLQPG